MSKRNDEEIFSCQCPVFDCNNTKIVNWHHHGCSSIWELYISDKAILRCENCGDIDEFFNCKFDCGSHGGESDSSRFRSPTSLKKVLALIGALEDDGVYSSDFVDQIADALRKQYKKKKNK